MTLDNPYGMVAFYPEHRPKKWWKPKELHLVWTVERITPTMTSGGRLDEDKVRRRFKDPADAMELFEKWKAENPKATVQWLGFETVGQ